MPSRTRTPSTSTATAAWAAAAATSSLPSTSNTAPGPPSVPRFRLFSDPDAPAASPGAPPIPAAATQSNADTAQTNLVPIQCGPHVKSIASLTPDEITQRLLMMYDQGGCDPSYRSSSNGDVGATVARKAATGIATGNHTPHRFRRVFIGPMPVSAATINASQIQLEKEWIEAEAEMEHHDEERRNGGREQHEWQQERRPLRSVASGPSLASGSVGGLAASAPQRAQLPSVSGLTGPRLRSQASNSTIIERDAHSPTAAEGAEDPASTLRAYAVPPPMPSPLLERDEDASSPLMTQSPSANGPGAAAATQMNDSDSVVPAIQGEGTAGVESSYSHYLNNHNDRPLIPQRRKPQIRSKDSFVSALSASETKTGLPTADTEDGTASRILGAGFVEDGTGGGKASRPAKSGRNASGEGKSFLSALVGKPKRPRGLGRNDSQASFLTAQSSLSGMSNATIMPTMSNGAGTEAQTQTQQSKDKRQKQQQLEGKRTSTVLSPIPGSTLLEDQSPAQAGSFSAFPHGDEPLSEPPSVIASSAVRSTFLDVPNTAGNTSTTPEPTKIMTPTKLSNSASRSSRRGWSESNADDFQVTQVEEDQEDVDLGSSSSPPAASPRSSLVAYPFNTASSTATGAGAGGSPSALRVFQQQQLTPTRRERKPSWVTIVDSSPGGAAAAAASSVAGSSPASAAAARPRTTKLSFEQGTTPAVRARDSWNSASFRRDTSTASLDTVRPLARRAMGSTLSFGDLTGANDAASRAERQRTTSLATSFAPMATTTERTDAQPASPTTAEEPLTAMDATDEPSGHVGGASRASGYHSRQVSSRSRRRDRSGLPLLAHRRDASRMSRVSTVGSVGTHGTQATHATEGSFGAVGGVRATLHRVLHPRIEKEKRERQKIVAARAARSVSMRHIDGHQQLLLEKRKNRKRSGSVDPLQVGTSSGGTRWIGESFEVGAAVEEQLTQRLDRAARHVEQLVLDAEKEEEEMEEQEHAERQEKRQKALDVQRQEMRRPSAALAIMAEDATNVTHSRENTIDGVSKRPQPIAKQEGNRRSKAFDEASSIRSAQMRPRTMLSPKVTTDSARTSIFMTHAQGVNHAPTLDIENRKGWADIAAMMNVHNGKIGENKPIKVEHASEALNTVRSKSKDARPPLSLSQSQAAQLVSDSPVKITQSPVEMVSVQEKVGSEKPSQEVPVVALETSSEVEAPNEKVEAAAIGPTLNVPGKESSVAPKKSVQFARSSPVAEAGAFLRSITTPKRSPSREDPPILDSDEPAPPEEVLQRSQTDVEEVDDTARRLRPYKIKAADTDEVITHKTALRRDRMLVKIEWTAAEDLPIKYDELVARRYSTYTDDWSEYMVVLRMGRLELWEETPFIYKLSGRAKQLKLKVVLGLRKGHTFQSLYSPIDGIFCLSYTCSPNRATEKSRSLHVRKSGTNILIFDARTLSSARQWMWDISRELGISVPEVLDVNLPDLNVRVRIPVPDEANNKAKEALGITVDDDEEQIGEGYKLMTTRNITEIVSNLLKSNPRWLSLARDTLNARIPMELAWRVGRRLEWVDRSRFIAGSEVEESAVMEGLLLGDRCHEPVLELRPAHHHLGTILQRSGETLEEPPAIEGFLWRVKAVSGALTRIYVSSHDGHIFAGRSNRAPLPDRELVAMLTAQEHPGTAKLVEDVLKSRSKRGKKASRQPVQRELDVARELALEALRDQSDQSVAKQLQAYRVYERCRQFEQIVTSDGYVDLRDIIECKLIDPEEETPNQGQPEDTQSRDSSWHNISNMAADDVGGEEGLASAPDRAKLRTRRQFEMVLANGKTIRFEAFSIAFASEWTKRINELMTYWKARERFDAQELMATSNHHLDANATFLEGGELDSRLASVWSWCPLSGCRTIVKCGRLYRKWSASEAFQGRYYVLLQGRLLMFKLMQSTKSARARQNAGIFHRRQETVIHLRDAYVYSGKLTEAFSSGSEQAAQNLGAGTGSGERHRMARVYRDGLQSFDDEEDCTFVIRYRPQRVNTAADPTPQRSQSGEVFLKAASGAKTPTGTSAYMLNLPPLDDATYRTLVLRARSRLERDLWVKGISTEIERLCLDDAEREEALRNRGLVPYKSLS